MATALVPDAQGYCDDRFAEVRRAFAANFADREEVGASVCVIQDGTTVVDLWGGEKHDGTPWERDTKAVVYSATKGATAVCAHLLATRGELDFDDKVGRYWPAFQSSEKRNITIRMLLNHSSGLQGTSVPLSHDDLFDWDRMVDVLEKETPSWRPGSRWGYAGMTYGFLVGEVVRRVAGESIGTFFRKNVADTLQSDFWIGLPEDRESEVSHKVIAPWVFSELESEEALFTNALIAGNPLQVGMMNSHADYLEPGTCDLPGAHQAEIPAAGGITNGRGLARLYAPLSLPTDEVEFVSRDQHAQMIATEVAGECAVTLMPLRFSTGFEKANPGTASVVTQTGQVHSETGFGHTGFGGSFGMACPEGRFAFGYVSNRHSRGDERYLERAQSMLDAVYRTLGFRSKASGKWSR